MNATRMLSVAVLATAAVAGIVAARWLLSDTPAGAGHSAAGVCVNPDDPEAVARSLALHGGTATPPDAVSAQAAPTPSPPGMVWVPGGSFTMGSDAAYPEEGPASERMVEGFWIDQFEVTNARFAEFVAATGYVTLAERGVRTANRPDAPVVRGSAVFRPRDGVPAMASPVPYWWEFVAGASWHAPEGPGSSIAGREHYPVVHVAYEDAQAFAQWQGRRLPTEAQFEYAAQGSGHRDASGAYGANTWQGTFPTLDAGDDGFRGLAPVGCYSPDAHGAYDLIGNVWEWTASPFYASHDFDRRDAYPNGFDPTQPDEPAVAVIKGGSFLCSPDYCMRYRPEARIGQSIGLGASHIGFRTILLP